MMGNDVVVCVFALCKAKPTVVGVSALSSVNTIQLNHQLNGKDQTVVCDCLRKVGGMSEDERLHVSKVKSVCWKM